MEWSLSGKPARPESRNPLGSVTIGSPECDIRYYPSVSEIRYNTFGFLNMKSASSTLKISRLLRAISQPSRLEILLAIGSGEACVCHLEAYLGQRQAYISQHLMALREVGIVGARREGRNIFYYLKDKQTLDLVQQAAGLAGIPQDELQFGTPATLLPNCTCPHCSPDIDGKPNLINPQQLLAEIN